CCSYTASSTFSF
nr:immunoglobulin light chain junction region [Macaca mulatta]